jgi:phosphoribosylformylglycinamidine synthase
MARDGAGVDVHLDRVPLREPDLEPWEIMISESQERMVACVAPGKLADVAGVLARWELAFAEIGIVTRGGLLRVFHGDDVAGEIPAALLTDECPRYEVGETLVERARAPVDRANLEPKHPIFERYDHLVGSRTVRRPGLDAAVLRLSHTRGLAVSLDGPPPGERNAYAAGRAAVYGAALNVACAGGEPIGLTDCLNFGNPEKPEIGGELRRAIEGIAEAAEELGIPVVSGNVSLYNETDGRAIPPTPVVGCVGLVRDVTRIPARWRRGDIVALLRGEGAELVHFVWQQAERFSLAHDVSWGGLEKTLSEAAAWSRLLPSQVTPCCKDDRGVVVAYAAGTALDWSDLVELGTV